jgi:hypothetical protein
MADPENKSAVDDYFYFLYIVFQFFPKKWVTKSRGPPPYSLRLRIFNPTPVASLLAPRALRSYAPRYIPLAPKGARFAITLSSLRG